MRDSANRDISRGLARVCVWALAPVGLVVADRMLPPATFGWDFANLLAFAAVGVSALLFFETGRPRARPAFEGRYFINLHRDLGVVALVLVSLHVVYLLVDEPVTVEYLLPTAPFYMWAGIGGYLVLITLVAFGFKRARVALFVNHRAFRTVHAFSAVAFFGLAAWHVLGAGFYLRTGPGVVLAVCAAVAVVGAWWARRGRPHESVTRRAAGVAHVPEWMALGVIGVVLTAAGLVAVLRLD